jgi:hypothetical protein
LALVALVAEVLMVMATTVLLHLLEQFTSAPAVARVPHLDTQKIALWLFLKEDSTVAQAEVLLVLLRDRQLPAGQQFLYWEIVVERLLLVVAAAVAVLAQSGQMLHLALAVRVVLVPQIL